MTILQYKEQHYIVLTWEITEESTCALCTNCKTGAISRFGGEKLNQAKIIEHDGYKVGIPLLFDKRYGKGASVLNDEFG